MFNRCRRWRALLTRRADGRLTLQELGALEDHLALCPCCRSADEADRALRDVCNLHIAVLDGSASRAFDDRVVADLKASPARIVQMRLTQFCRQWQARC